MKGFIVALFLLFPSSSLALQLHREPEGFYVHQMAHVLFFLSMGILIYWLYKTNLSKIRAWKFIRWSALFFMLWNFNAFVGHAIEESSGFYFKDAPLIGKVYVNFRDNLPATLLYYFLKLDHLFCVPAIYFLFKGLDALIKEEVE